jgi:hypothetical protein
MGILLAEVASAAKVSSVAKEDLAAQVGSSIERVLRRADVSKNASEAKREKHVQSVASRFVSAIQKIPQKNLNAGLASWIQHSIASLISRNADRLMDLDAPTKPFIDSLQLEQRFGRLTQKEAQKLLARRKKLMKAGNQYRKELLGYVLNRLSEVKRIELSIDLFTSRQSIMSVFKFATNMTQDRDNEHSKIKGDLFMLRKDQIGSSLTTFVFVRQIQSRWLDMQRMGSFSEGNILSLAFAKGATQYGTSIKDFSDVREDVEAAFRKAVQRNGQGGVKIDYRRIMRFFHVANSLRVGKKVTLEKGEFSGGKLIVFSNHLVAWEQLTNWLEAFNMPGEWTAYKSNAAEPE